MKNIKFRSDKEILIRRMTKIVTVVTFLCILLGTIFTVYIYKTEENACKNYLENLVKQTASNIRGRVKNDIQMLAVLSGGLSTYTSSFSETDVTSFLLKNVADEKYHRLSFTYPNGKNVRVQSGIGKLPSEDMEALSCFSTAMGGSPCFSDVTEEPLAKSGYVNRYYVPVYDKNHNVAGMLGSMIDTDIFKTILDYSDFDDKGYSNVIDSDGNYLIKSSNEKNVFSNFFGQRIKYIGTTKDKLIEEIKSHDSGTFWYKWINGKTYLAAYAFIGNSNSYVISNVPKDVIMLHFNTVLRALLMVVLIIGMMLLILLRYTEKLYKDNEAAIYKVAFTDEVTESANKTKFILEAEEILQQNKDEKFAMISMDITKFKVINELFGYNRANKILKDVYSIVKRNLTKGSVCERDFAATYVILYKYEKGEFIKKYFIDKILNEIEKYNEEVMSHLVPEYAAKVQTKLALSFGIYLVNDTSLPVAQMCDRASIAKRNIKDDVINIYRFYDDGLRAKILQDKAVEDEMYTALEKNQFQMYLQPKINLQTMELDGAEALVRWVHSLRGIVPPIDFIPIFEKNGFIIELDKCIWKQACEFLSHRKKQNLSLFPISVNVSRLHLNNDAFIDELLNLIKMYDIEPELLELELTESACLDNEKHFSEIMYKLKSYGFKISMDDFGVGYSSLNMLRHLPVDVLKLDRGFITDTIGNQKGETVIKNVLKMAEELNMKTVAEGVETAEQVAFLKQYGCKVAQGFLYGRPMSIDHFVNMFLNDKKDVSS